MVVVLVDFYEFLDLCGAVSSHDIGLVDDPREFTGYLLAFYLQFHGFLVDLVDAAHVTVGVKHASLSDGAGDQRYSDRIIL